MRRLACLTPAASARVAACFGRFPMGTRFRILFSPPGRMYDNPQLRERDMAIPKRAVERITAGLKKYQAVLTDAKN